MTRSRTKDIDYSDIPPLDASFFKKALVTWPPKKLTVTIRLDADVVEWLKKGGKGYQTRINHLLRRFMDASSKSRVAR
ncbi:MAG: BrnA antitoxin family protein [Nitrospinae bacterium]|nr:BrnA antitoxin family protein [Nitrospinota bacterium]